MQTRYEKIIITALLGLFLLSVLIGGLMQSPLAPKAQSSSFSLKQSIAVIPVYGMIRLEENDFFTQSGIDAVRADLDELGTRSDVKAIILRVNSPGGPVGSSQELYSVVKDFKERTKKPIVVSIVDVGASGAYWVAMASDHIVAHPGSLVGSLGVIIQSPDFSDLKNRYGIGFRTYKSGEMKDLLNPWRPSTDAERDLIQSRLDDIHRQFIDVLVSERQMDRTRATELADGRIFTGRQALEQGLIDELGGFDTAVSKAAALANIQGEPHIIRPGDMQFRNVVKSFRSAFQGVMPFDVQGGFQVR